MNVFFRRKKVAQNFNKIEINEFPFYIFKLFVFSSGAHVKWKFHIYIHFNTLSVHIHLQY